MEATLDQILHHVKPKFTYPIVCTGKGSRLNINFDPPIILPAECTYELALVSLDTYYSFPNIDVENNSLRILVENVWSLIEIPRGCYEIKTIQDEIRRSITIKGGDATNFTLIPNHSTLRCVMKITKALEIDFGVPNSIFDVLGMEKKIYRKGIHTGEKMVNIMKVNSILVQTDIIQGSRLNGKELPIIATFFPNVSPGYKLIWRGHTLIYCPLTLNVISNMSCWLTDQDNKALDLGEEELTVSFLIKAC